MTISRRLLAAFDSSITVGPFAVTPGDNRWRVRVAHQGVTTAGTVMVALDGPRPDAPETRISSKIAELLWDADGGVASGTMGPADGDQVTCRMTGWAGAGKTVVLFETWQEGLS